MNIPMVDLKGQYESLRAEIEEGFRNTFAGSQFILGPNVRALEEEIARYCGVRHAVAVASGTDALHLALRAAGIGEGDEVITTAFTFIATAEAISYVGARPIFVDIDPNTFNIDVARIEAAITAKTKAILPVHLFGQPADLEPMAALCRHYGLRLIEDCAQSFGADYQGKKTGAWGDLGCFSFFPSKNLGCYGDGGMVVTDDADLAESVRVFANHGSRVRYHHSVLGYNSRLDELQAVILRIKLRYLDEYNHRRRANARLYTARLEGRGVVPPVEAGGGTHVYHQYTVLTDKRECLQKRLSAAGIASAVYYPIPLHRQEVYREELADTVLEEAELAAARVLSLPMYPELSEAQIERVCDVLLAAIEGQE